MATQTITVQDTTAPMLSIPADYTAECDEELVFDDASAMDNCGTTVTITVRTQQRQRTEVTTLRHDDAMASDNCGQEYS